MDAKGSLTLRTDTVTPMSPIDVSHFAAMLRPCTFVARALVASETCIVIWATRSVGDEPCGDGGAAEATRPVHVLEAHFCVLGLCDSLVRLRSKEKRFLSDAGAFPAG